MLSLLIASIGSGVSMIGFSAIIVSVARDLGVSLGSASFGVLGIMTFVMAVGVAIFGAVIDRFGVFKVLVGSQLIFVLAWLAIPLAGHDFVSLVLCRLFHGLAAAGVAVSVTPAMARSFRPQEMGRAMGFQAIGIPLGMTVGLLAVPRLVSATGDWRTAMALISVIGILSLIVTVGSAKAWRRLESLTDFGPEHRIPFRHIAATPIFWYGVIVSVILFMTGLTFLDLVPGYLSAPAPVGAGYGPVRAGNLAFPAILSGFVAPLLAGFLVDKVFRGDAKPVLVLGWLISLMAPLVLFPSVVGVPAILVTVLLVEGLAQPFVSITMMSTAARVCPPEIVGRVAGTWLSVSFFSGAAGTMLGSAALHATGTYRMTLIAIGVANLIGLIFTLSRPSPSARG